MFAIYPPSEDVMVGDIFLHIPDARFFDLVRITSAPRSLLAEQLCYQEGDRLASDAIKDGADGAGTTLTQCRRNELRRVLPFDGTTGTSHLTRLREAAIPTLEVGRFSEGEIGGAGLFGNFGAALGVGRSGAAALRVELKSLQTLTLDELRGSRLIEDISISRIRRVNREGGTDYPNTLTPLMLIRSLVFADNRNGTQTGARFCRGDFSTLDRTGARIVVANRILYAGAVNFDFMTQTVGTMRLAIDFASTLANLPQAPVVPTLSGASPPPPKDAAGAPPAALGKPAETPPREAGLDFEAHRTALMAAVARVITLPADTPGRAAARLTTGRFGNLTLHQPFARPAAVGMGAALHFSLADAAIPANQEQVEDALVYCRFIYGGPTTILEQRLKANLSWALYLTRREAGSHASDQKLYDWIASQSGAPQPAVQPRTALPRLVPSANIRVRL
ncbi:hypothetical protein [Muricoccus pecuniae]|uniref:Uncharacterized protein n=1 Tax=Muricoccus pecuniae TaxID=693023 RepID=A0A840YMN0_9PROT|nr:hypothetical protein [Roseomonas pecuniae]MBB5695964.1 hypothetical protein [Roseomonas pecuniae]